MVTNTVERFIFNKDIHPLKILTVLLRIGIMEKIYAKQAK